MQTPYGTGPTTEAPGATAGLVLGILSIVLGFPVVQLILAYIGFTKSKEAKRLCEANPGMYSNAGVATAGYICSIIGLVLGCLSLLLCCGYVGVIVLAIGGAATGAAAGSSGGFNLLIHCLPFLF